ncbi:MAG: class I SAM-dependent methyltransferase [Bacteroidales bacterium]|nr:class I SAM-dependent methyltransferase [Bacteroidales bacterium]
MAIEELPTQRCFICNGTEFHKFLRLNDYFLSQEVFELCKCLTCGLLYTLPQPDPESIIKYYNSNEYTSHNTAQRSLKNLLYLQARKIALGRKMQMIKEHQEIGQILDIGAGTAEFLNYCRKQKWNITGVEPNAKGREIAFERHGIILQHEVDLSILEKGSMDVITMWHVLEHIADPLSQLELNYQLLNNKNGMLVLALPNYESWDAKKYGKFWAAYDVPRHLYHFTKESVKLLAEKSGFRIVEIHPMKFDSFYICLLSEKYKHGKMNYVKAFANGIRSNSLAKKDSFGYSSLVYLLKKA